mmetsp:Transcript_46562/g.134143  ORF Transcript_46562/g.134143 Transcript_46562/m.134143 type:complete len:225 (+) Transcript_46562:113-787(+)
MDRSERLAVRRALGGLVPALRRWEAADAVATSELRRCIQGLMRAEYIALGHAGLLGMAGMCSESLQSARRLMQRRSAVALQQAHEHHQDMEEVLTNLERILADEALCGSSLAREGQRDASPQCKNECALDATAIEIAFGAEANSLASAFALRGALQTLVNAMGSELALRRSLLTALRQIPPSDQDELRRLLVVWSERPFTDPSEGSSMEKLQRRVAFALESFVR